MVVLVPGLLADSSVPQLVVRSAIVIMSAPSLGAFMSLNRHQSDEAEARAVRAITTTTVHE